jgi:transcriptional regulator with XRE-family HTH domain
MNNNFGKNLRFLRNQMKISQQEVADFIGKKKSMISNYERGVSEPAITEVLKLKELFKITIQMLVEIDLENDNPDLSEGNREINISGQQSALKNNNSGYGNKTAEEIISVYEKMTDRQQNEIEHLVQQLHDIRMELIDKQSKINELAIQNSQLESKIEDLESNKNVG